MATRESGGQQRSTRREDEAPEPEDAAAPTGASAQHEKMSDDVDSILDEIDDVLEENAEEFVRQFVQKGGQ